MASLNKVMLIGNLGKDPEVTHFESGAIKASFPLATSEKYTNRDGQLIDTTEWHNIVIWGKLAEVADRYLRKGKQVYIEGKITTRSWDDETGKKNYITEIKVTSFVMLGRKGDESGEYSSGTDNNRSANKTNSPKPPVNQNSSEGSDETVKPSATVEEVDDLPF